MNATFLGIVNGIATAAKNASDPESVSTCEHIIQIAEFSFGTQYDAATSVASPLVIKFPDVTAVDVLTSFDSITGQGDIRAAGG